MEPVPLILNPKPGHAICVGRTSDGLVAPLVKDGQQFMHPAMAYAVALKLLQAAGRVNLGDLPKWEDFQSQ